ncbi:alkaline phosphatase [Candidatus Riflebacteria bacterium]
MNFSKPFQHLVSLVLLTLLVSIVDPLPPIQAREKRPKNIILIIGDGMGPQQVGMYNYYTYMLKHRPSSFEKIANKGHLGMSDTHAYFQLVTDSAAAGTTLATGFKTRCEVLGIGPHGEDLETVLEYAQTIGKSTGIVTNTAITHATPGAFYAAVESRHMGGVIVNQLLENGKIDVILGGGMKYFIPKKTHCNDFASLHPLVSGKSRRRDNINLLEKFQSLGYDLLFRNSEIINYRVNRKKKILGLFAHGHLPYEVDRMHMENLDTPSVLEMTKLAIARLSKNPKGFFLMVESGRIDHLCHGNDSGGLLREMEITAKTAEYALQFAQKRKDTLVIVTADHETGSPGFSYLKRKEGKLRLKLESGKTYVTEYNYISPQIYHLLLSQKRTYASIVWEAKKDPQKLIELFASYTPFRINLKEANIVLTKYRRDFKAFYSYPASRATSVLSSIISDQTAITWATGTHTNTPVLCVSYGPYSRHLKGFFQNTHIARVIFKAFGNKGKVFPLGL